MEFVATNFPPEIALVCETCGYELRGLPPGVNCPECGHPIAESDPSNRHLTDWERSAGPTAFISTSAAILFHPGRFYRSLRTRKDRRESRRFAIVHWVIASLLLGFAEYVHFTEFVFFDISLFNSLMARPIFATLFFSAIIILLLFAMTPLAAWLTSLEARYRGYRLPLPVVARGLDYHAAHYLPVAIVTTLTIVGYRWLVAHRFHDTSSAEKYLYVLCGEVIVAAVYLFFSYWIAMRNMMYANA